MATLPQLKPVSDHHTSPGQAGTVFVRARPKLAVYSHFILIGATAEEVVSRTRRTYQGALQAGEDLMRFTIGSGVAVKKWDPDLRKYPGAARSRHDEEPDQSALERQLVLGFAGDPWGGPLDSIGSPSRSPGST